MIQSDTLRKLKEIKIKSLIITFALYPSIMRQFQISPETFMFKDKNYVPKSDEIKCCSGAVYKKDPNAMLPAILTHYFALRKAAKKDKKQANSEYEELKHILEKRKAS